MRFLHKFDQVQRFQHGEGILQCGAVRGRVNGRQFVCTFRAPLFGGGTTLDSERPYDPMADKSFRDAARRFAKKVWLFKKPVYDKNQFMLVEQSE